MSKQVATTEPVEIPTQMRPSLPRKPPCESKLPWAHVYTEEVADRICEEVALGRSLARIALEEPWAPTLYTLTYWMKQRPELRAAYELALQIRAETIAAEVIELADASIDHDHTKLQIGARQWLAPKLSPRFRDRQIVEATNTNKTEVQVTTVEQIDVSHLSMDEIRAMEGLLMKTIEGEVIDGGDDGEA